MNDLLIGLLAVALATNTPSALSNALHQRTGLALAIPDKNNPLEREYLKLLADDDAAQSEVDQWIKDAQKAGETGDPVGAATLRARVRQRLEPVKKAYEDFLRLHSNHTRARLAYGSFLNDIGEEAAAEAQWLKARELDPKNPAAWNNLANFYGHNGGVMKSFEYYQKAIELAPTEPVYHHNFADTVFLFRKDAGEYFKLTEAQVFDKALGLYRRALELDPENFLLAANLAESYYAIRPPKTGDAGADRQAAQKHADDAVAAWQAAMKLARDDIERQGVLIHFARFQINAGRFDEARANLNAVTNSMFDSTKRNLNKKLQSEESKAKSTTALPIKIEGK
ncbi:MAG TPA: tetratricopeptide repeat protein [Candidatus Eisenbacteria bacterium]|nr:tetratricopeptide repeat protein [Candidatus Eisenbacteria bacterium]